MPTITQLPPSDSVDPADEIPLSQGGVAHSVSVGTLLAGTQPAILANQGSLLGRTSLGPGGPEPVGVGSGLLLAGSTLVATGLDHASFPTSSTLTATDQVVLNSAGVPKLLPISSLRGLFTAGANVAISATGTISAAIAAGPVTASGNISALPIASSISAGDLIPVSQGGVDHAISYAALLDGQTIDQAQPAAPAGDADTFWVAQGSSALLRQTFAALWAWLMIKLPSFKQPVVEITTDTTLDTTVHNHRILVCSQPVTLTAAPLNMGSGFCCDIINVSVAPVTLAGGIITSSGTSTISAGQAATLRCATYSGGTVLFAVLSGMPGGSVSGGAALPGQPASLSVTSVTIATASLTWTAPNSGGNPTSYVIQYRQSGTSAWLTAASGVAATSQTISGLSSNTSYDFQVFAVNGAGSGTPSSIVTAATDGQANNVTAIVWNVAPSGSYAHGTGVVAVNVHVTPATSAVQFGFSSSSSAPPTAWTPATFVNTDLWGAYVPVPATPGTYYAWVEGTDGSAPTVYATSFVVT